MSLSRGRRLVALATENKKGKEKGVSDNSNQSNEVSSTLTEYSLRQRNQLKYSVENSGGSESPVDFSDGSSDNFYYSGSEDSKSTNENYKIRGGRKFGNYHRFVEKVLKDAEKDWLDNGDMNVASVESTGYKSTSHVDEIVAVTSVKSSTLKSASAVAFQTDNLRTDESVNEIAIHKEIKSLTLDDKLSVCSDSINSESCASDVVIPYVSQISMNTADDRNKNELVTENIGQRVKQEKKLPKITVLQNIEVKSGIKSKKIAATVEYNNISLDSINDTEIPRHPVHSTITLKENVVGVIMKFGEIVQESSKIVEHFENRRAWTKRTTCPYCFQDVTHFPRHLERNHKVEGAVIELLSLPEKDPQKKLLLNAIRRQGNFVLNSHSNVIRPVRRPKQYTSTDKTCIDNMDEGKETYVICQHCLGYYKRNYLRRHMNVCTLRPRTNKVSERENHLTESQIFAVCTGANQFYNSLRLKNEVFPIMRADEISKVAMNDTLVCSFAESLLRKHKRTQIRTTISNKMRELGRLLIQLRKTTGAQKLVDILKPEFFDNIITATKVISGYNHETRTFKAGSLALHLGTTLKQVCDIATNMIFKKSPFLRCRTEPEVTLKNIKRIRNLVERQWNSELSSLALKVLNEIKWEKPKLLPLTSDVITFQRFLVQEAKTACDKLKNEKEDMKMEYRRLTEIVLALTLLLNRKRIGEIQYLKVKTYNIEVPLHQQEEFVQSLSNAEKILTKNFKRDVTGGKGSNPVAILFPKNIQKCIDLLLKVRNQYVANTNEYLFANPSTDSKWLSGYHVLRKWASAAGVKNEELFTSTRLRKQISTILQVLNISETEMEQFAAFMGHTMKTHSSYYRLPQDVFQTAKVSKLLLAISKGKGAEYKGKTLDEINLSEGVESDDSDGGCENPKLNFSKGEKLPQSKATDARTDSLEENVAGPSGVVSNKRKVNVDHVDESSSGSDSDGSVVPDTTNTTKKRKIQRNRWAETEKNVLKEFFKTHIEKKCAPKKHEVEEVMNKNKNLFKGRNWATVKAFVYNCYRDK